MSKGVFNPEQLLADVEAALDASDISSADLNRATGRMEALAWSELQKQQKLQRHGRKYGREQDTAKKKVARIEVLRLELVPTITGTEGDAELLRAARQVLEAHDMKQTRNDRLREEIAAART